MSATIECLKLLNEPSNTAENTGKESSDLDLPKQYYKNKAEGEINA